MYLWRRILTGAGLLALLIVAACATDGGEAITVRVDYSHDEFATQFIRYFPNQIQAHPGDTIRFVQDWTGEAHTVTFGTAVTTAANVAIPLLEEYGDVPEDQVPPEVLEEYFAAECSLPVLYTECEAPPEGAEDAPFAVNQTLAQPCLIEEGTIPLDGAACQNQELGEFDGTETYYNSGFLGFETENENVFELKLSSDIAPGDYQFFCSVHGFFQASTLQVLSPSQPLPSPGEVNQETRQELNEAVGPFRQVFDRAQEGTFVFGGESLSGNFSGLVDEQVDGLLNEFVPKEITADVDVPITWLMFGPHSISFDVPEYFPIYDRADDGSIVSNEEIYDAAGGAPRVPEEPVGPPGTEGNPTEPVVIDGGTWDGEGFWSSGVLYSEAYVQYTLRISEPGTYRYACLIHPPMVGTVVVNG